MQLWTSDFGISLELLRQTSLSISAGPGYERLLEEEFGPKRAPSHPGAFIGPDSERSSYRRNISASMRTTPSKSYSMNVAVTYTWDAFDFDFGSGPRFPRVSPAAPLNPQATLDPGVGNSLDVVGSFTYQPTNAFRTSP